MKYTVASFDVSIDEERNIVNREYVVLGKNLSWEDAKAMQRQNRGSWTYRQNNVFS